MFWITKCIFWITIISTTALKLPPPEKPDATSRNEARKPINERKAVATNGIITFPGPISTDDRAPVITDDCKKIGICETVPDYPREYINKLIENLGETGTQILTTLDILEPKEDELGISNRFGAPEDSIELCSFHEKIIYPERGQAEDGSWHDIINNRDKPLQGFRVEICSEDDKDSLCNTTIANIKPGYKASCRQKYVYRSMATAGNTTTEVVHRNIKVPACCSCVVGAIDYL